MNVDIYNTLCDITLYVYYVIVLYILLQPIERGDYIRVGTTYCQGRMRERFMVSLCRYPCYQSFGVVVPIDNNTIGSRTYYTYIIYVYYYIILNAYNIICKIYLYVYNLCKIKCLNHNPFASFCDVIIHYKLYIIIIIIYTTRQQRKVYYKKISVR